MPAPTELRRGIRSGPATFTVSATSDVSTAIILSDLFEGLVTTSPDGNIAPGAALKWSVSEDGLVYRFTLREGLYWSNGDPIIAQHFVDGLRHAVSPGSKVQRFDLFSRIANAENIYNGIAAVDTLGIKAIDDQALEIRLVEPTPYFLEIAATVVYAPEHPENRKINVTNIELVSQLITNGAYQIDTYSEDKKITLSRNARYWDVENVGYEKVTYQIEAQTDGEVDAYRRNELDLTSSLTGIDYAVLRREFPDEFKVLPSFGTFALSFNTSQPPFDDVRLRQALSITLDRDAIANEFLNGANPGAWGLIPPHNKNYKPHIYAWRKLPRNEQLAIARSLYIEAGYSLENPLSFAIQAVEDASYNEVIEEYRRQLKTHLGIETTITRLSWHEFLAEKGRGQAWKMSRLSVGGPYVDANSLLSSFLSENRFNPSLWKSKEFDALLTSANLELNPKRRQLMLSDAESLLMSSYPIVPVFFHVSKKLAKPHVGGEFGSIADIPLSRYLYPLPDTENL
ncbi:MAG: peptide ABC transporter substrate-binding protein [Woeseiaceae bacterium]